SLEDSASVRDQHCNEGQRLGRKPEVGTFVNSQVAGAVGVSWAAGCSLTGNGDCSRFDVPEREHASSSPQGRVAGADCGSVLLITAIKSQSSAWRKSERVLRLSVDRRHPGKLGRRRRLMMTASPKLIPGSLGIGNSGTKLFKKSRHEEPFGMSQMRNHAGKNPIGLNSVA